MVDIADLAHVNALYAEADAIDMALVNFKRGGTIIRMTVNAWPPEGEEMPDDAPEVEQPGWATVDTSHIDYPAQMTAAIRQQLMQRRETIDSELTSLGVTGLGAQPRDEPQQQPQQAAPAVRPAAARPRPGGG